MENPIYNLPEILFVAGETQTFFWNLLSGTKLIAEPFDADGCSLGFAMARYPDNPIDEPILIKPVELREDSDGRLSIAVVYFEPLDTVALSGKFTYQLSIRSFDGEIEIPSKGFIYISQNIDTGFIYNNE